MNAALLALLIAALLGIQMLIGGTRPLFAIPCYAVIAVAALLCAFQPARRPPRALWPTLLATLLLAGYVAVRALFSPVAYLAWPDFFEILACLMVYLLVVFHLHEPRYLAWIFAVLLLLAMASVLVGLRQFSFADDFMPLGLTRPTYGRRASGFLISPNHLAGFLEVIGIFALSFACWSSWRGWLRGLMLYMAIASFAGVAITGSRGGYLSVAFALAIFGLLSVAVVGSLDRRRAMLLGFFGLLAGGLAVAGAVQVMSASPLLKARMDMLENQFTGVNLDWRRYNWQAAWEQAQVSPWTGTGAGTHLYFGRLFRRPVLQSDAIHAHCDYLELLAEYGWLGAAAMALFVGTHLRAGWLRLRETIRDEVLATSLLRHTDVAIYLGSLSAVAAYLCHSVVDFNLHIPGNALCLALVFAVLGRPSPAAQRAPSASFISARAALPALGLWLFLTGLPKLPGEYWTEEMRKALLRKQYPTVFTLNARIPDFYPNAERYFYLGEANRAFGSAIPLRSLRASYFQRAAVALRQSLALFPQNEVAWVRLAQTLDALGQFREADTAYLTALALDPNLGVLYGYYAAHLRMLGHARQAHDMLEKAERFSAESYNTIHASGLDEPPPPAIGL